MSRRAIISRASAATEAARLVDALGVGVGNARTAFAGTCLAGQSNEFTDGVALHGTAATELTRLCNAAGLSWSIQEGQLLVLPLGGSLARTAIPLAADSGMNESPTFVARRTVKLKCLIQSGLVPGQRVVVESRLVQAEMRISEVTYSGETEGQSWEADLTHAVALLGLETFDEALRHAPPVHIDPVACLRLGHDSDDGVRFSLCRDGRVALTKGTDVILEVDASGTVHIGGAAGDFVALAGLVKERLDTIQAAFDAHTHVVAGTTAAAGAPIVATVAASTAIGPLAAVAATQAKAV